MKKREYSRKLDVIRGNLRNAASLSKEVSRDYLSDTGNIGCMTAKDKVFLQELIDNFESYSVTAKVTHDNLLLIKDELEKIASERNSSQEGI